MKSYWTEFIRDCGDTTGAMLAGYGVGASDLIALAAGILIMAISVLSKGGNKL